MKPTHLLRVLGLGVGLGLATPVAHAFTLTELQTAPVVTATDALAAGTLYNCTSREEGKFRYVIDPGIALRYGECRSKFQQCVHAVWDTQSAETVPDGTRWFDDGDTCNGTEVCIGGRVEHINPPATCASTDSRSTTTTTTATGTRSAATTSTTDTTAATTAGTRVTTAAATGTTATTRADTLTIAVPECDGATTKTCTVTGMTACQKGTQRCTLAGTWGACTVDALPDGTAVADNNVCNGNEVCQNGAIVPGVALVCDDGNSCNGTETCNATSGCQAGLMPDADGDGVGDCKDLCPNDAKKILPGECGCGVADLDADGDGVMDCKDLCPSDNHKQAPGLCGCGIGDGDRDVDGTPDCNDQCNLDAKKTVPGVCGCGVADVDADRDGVMDCKDLCPEDAHKQAPGICGCGTGDGDRDGDGTPDCNDQCAQDAFKTAPGECGCGVVDLDGDSDGMPDCRDLCATDPKKMAPGVCGCGTADVDTDGDHAPDCKDTCPADEKKTAPGPCGCGVSDADGDGDHLPDCHDNCPAASNVNQLDSDGDRIGDACDAPSCGNGVVEQGEACDGSVPAGMTCASVKTGSNGTLTCAHCQIDQQQCLVPECQAGQSRACASPVGAQGACAAGGKQQCDNGHWSACQSDVLPRAEVCGNHADDDCDGAVDEDCKAEPAKAVEAPVRGQPPSVEPAAPAPERQAIAEPAPDQQPAAEPVPARPIAGRPVATPEPAAAAPVPEPMVTPEASVAPERGATPGAATPEPVAAAEATPAPKAAEAPAAPLFMPQCQSSSLFDCAKTRGWELSGVQHPIGLLHGQQGMYLAAEDGVHRLMLTAQAAPVQACAGDVPEPLLGVLHDDVVPIVHSARTLYFLQETADEPAAPGCTVEFRALPKAAGTCDGDIVAITRDADLNGDRIADIVTARVCPSSAGPTLGFETMLSDEQGAILSFTTQRVGKAADALHHVQMRVTQEADGAAFVMVYAQRAAAKADQAPTAIELRCPIVATKDGSGRMVVCPKAEQDISTHLVSKQSPKGSFVLASSPNAVAGVSTAVILTGAETCTALSGKSGDSVSCSGGGASDVAAEEITEAFAGWFAPKDKGHWTQAVGMYADTEQVHLSQLKVTDAMVTDTALDEHLVCASAQDHLEWTQDVQYVQPGHFLAADLDHFGGQELCTICRPRVAGSMIGSAVFCFYNQNETPQAHVAEPTAALVADDVVLSATGDDPSDDTLHWTWRAVDAAGRDVSTQVLVPDESPEQVRVRAMPLAAPTSRTFRPMDLLVATAFADDSVVWPITVTATGCDSGGACASASVAVHKGVGGTPVVESPPAPVPVAAPVSDPLADPTVAESASAPPASTPKESSAAESADESATAASEVARAVEVSQEQVIAAFGGTAVVVGAPELPTPPTMAPLGVNSDPAVQLPAAVEQPIASFTAQMAGGCSLIVE